jgi:hypothetical protein
MATDYAPVYKPGQAITRTTSADVTAGQVLYVTGVNTVGPTAGVQISAFGVAAFSALSGQDVTVLSGGVHILAAPSAVTAGHLVDRWWCRHVQRHDCFADHRRCTGHRRVKPRHRQAVPLIRA